MSRPRVLREVVLASADTRPAVVPAGIIRDHATAQTVKVHGWQGIFDPWCNVSALSQMKRLIVKLPSHKLKRDAPFYQQTMSGFRCSQFSGLHMCQHHPSQQHFQFFRRKRALTVFCGALEKAVGGIFKEKVAGKMLNPCTFTIQCRTWWDPLCKRELDWGIHVEHSSLRSTVKTLVLFRETFVPPLIELRLWRCFFVGRFLKVTCKFFHGPR